MENKFLVVAGASGVGKTELCSLNLRKKRVKTHKPTAENTYRWDRLINQEVVSFKIVEVGGDERNKGLLEVYLKNCTTFLLVYSITSQESFDELKILLAQIEACVHDEVTTVFIVGTKCDLEHARQVSYEDLTELANQHPCVCRFLEITSHDQLVVEGIFGFLYTHYLEVKYLRNLSRAKKPTSRARGILRRLRFWRCKTVQDDITIV